MIYIANKKRKIENLQKEFPEAYIIDTTSHANAEIRRLSPFYPHGGIPIPFSTGRTSMSVEGIWQGLKVFANEGIDESCFRNDTMKNLKRTARTHGGEPLGHQMGVHPAQGTPLLNYFDARMQIYLPSYKWVLDNVPSVHNLLERMKEYAQTHDVVLLDYNTNDDVRDISQPLSHASLVKLYIEGRYPSLADDLKPLTQEEVLARRTAKKEEKKERIKKNKNKKSKVIKEDNTVSLFDE